jgi:hypothetical protein
MTAIGLATEEETTIPGKQDYHLNQLPTSGSEVHLKAL